MIPFPTAFSDLLKSLNDHEVTYLVVGGYAVGFHGHARTTGDIDIWIEQSPANAERVRVALGEFGFDTEVLEPGSLLKEDQIVRMGYPPLRVEVMTSVSGVNFSDCYERRVEGELGEVETSLIGLDDLKANKRASGRLKDLNDLEKLS
ncbi:MAG: hypothetical protein BRD44_05705 [Bacteroidetes bacterium QS_7_67_15]|nr:MAG: hypothetical protein BRD44_05705 [Bacteroidetes bacterium QS_7_67_15]